MNKFFEMGLMITIFIISINAFIGVFGPATIGGADNNLSVMGYSIPTTDVNISQGDVNEMVTAGAGVIKSGDPFTETPGYLDILFPGASTVIASLSNIVAGYATVLYATLPNDLHPLVTIVTVILTFIQIFTVFYLILTLVSVVRDGHLGGDREALLSTCLVPDANTTFGTIFYCIGTMTFGSIQLAAIVFFIATMFVMWKAGVPLQASMPFAVILLFVLGSTTYATSPTFTNLLWLLIFGVAVMFVLALLHFARR